MSKKLSATDFICEGKKEGCFKPCKLHNEAGETFKPKEMGCVFMYKHPEWRRVEIEEKQADECPKVITMRNVGLKEIPEGFCKVKKGVVKHGDVVVLKIEKIRTIGWAWAVVGYDIQGLCYKVYRKMPDKKRRKA